MFNNTNKVYLNFFGEDLQNFRNKTFRCFNSNLIIAYF